MLYDYKMFNFILVVVGAVENVKKITSAFLHNNLGAAWLWKTCGKNP